MPPYLVVLSCGHRELEAKVLMRIMLIQVAGLL